MDVDMNIRLSLQSLIKWLTYEKKIHISIHYLSGDCADDDVLSLAPQNKVHYCSFCNDAKSTSAGLKICMKNKKKSINKAILLKKQYIGQCYLGITEIIKPIFIEGEPFCIIYIGNIIVNNYGKDAMKQISYMSKVTGVKKEVLFSQLESTEKTNFDKLKEYEELIELIASCIELHLFRKSKLQNKKMKENISDQKHWVVKQTLDYIEQYYATDIRLTHIADLFFINKQYLCRLFSKQVGESFSDCINKTRIAHAKELLLASDKKIIEIALMVGFNNVTYFNTVFKKYTHLTPKEFRKSPSKIIHD